MPVEVLALLAFIVIFLFIVWIAGRSSKKGDSSSDNRSARDTQYLSGTEESQELQESQLLLPEQWIHTDDNDRFYLAISLTDGSYCGPITLDELRAFELMPDYMVTTDKLGGNWYQACYFFCLADLFYKDMQNVNSSAAEGTDFKINEDGTITRLKKKKKS